MEGSRKSSNDGALSRKYRRRALAGDDGSSSSDASPGRQSKGDSGKVSNRKEADRSRHDSHRHDRYRSNRNDEYNKHEMDGRDSRGDHHSDRSRSRNDSDRHSRDKYRSSGHSNNGNDKEEKRGCRGDRYSYDKRKKHEEDTKMNNDKDNIHIKSPRDTENRDTHSKKLKGFVSAEEKPTTSSFKEEAGVSGGGDAAKVAAMEAAQLVNKNLVGTGYLTTDQKKKLLWGKKKSTVTEEPTHRWDSALVGDLERQEKFNKLMGVKASVVNQEQNLNEVQVEKQKELQMDLEKQYTAGLRRRDGRTVGLGL